MRTFGFAIAGALLAMAAFSSPAAAQDPAVDSARTAGQVGEQADGYLGVRGGASSDVTARVDQINLKRRALYTQLAAQRGVTVENVAAATACTLFASKVKSGEFYRAEDGQWKQNAGATAVKPPSFCGQ